MKPGTAASVKKAEVAVGAMRTVFRASRGKQAHTIELSEDVDDLDFIHEMGRLVRRGKGYLLGDTFVAFETNRSNVQAQGDARNYRKRASSLFVIKGQEPSASQQERMAEWDESASRLKIPRTDVWVPTTYGNHSSSQDTTELLLADIFREAGLAPPVDENPQPSGPLVELR